MHTSRVDGSDAYMARPRARAGLWIPSLVVGLATALVPFTGARALALPGWLALTAAALTFPLLPLLWHTVAERNRIIDEARPGSPLDRFGLRSVAVGLTVLGASLVSAGPKLVGTRLAGLLPARSTSAQRPIAPPAPHVPPSAPTAAGPSLETFIPQDASLAMALTGAPMIQQVLGVEGVDAKKGLDALGKCQIVIEHAQVLIAARDSGTRMVVVRAPGITDERNLYCLIGFLGNGRVALRFTGDKEQLRFQVEGLASRALEFHAVDNQTVVMMDNGWAATVDKKLFASDGAHGPLASIIARVDRKAGLWAAGFVRTEKGTFDLALAARLEGTQLSMQASSTPPSGEADRADAQVRVPAAFASALPERALAEGVRGLAALIAATGQGLPPASVDAGAAPAKSAAPAAKPKR